MNEQQRRIDYIKHINTLSTGSILLLASFLEKIIKSPHYPFLVMIVIGGFLFSVLGAVLAYTFEIVLDEDRRSQKFFLVIDFIFTFLMWIGFLVGIVGFGFLVYIEFVICGH